MEQSRCSICEDDFDQCPRCIDRDTQIRLDEPCETAKENGKHVPERECKLRTVNTMKEYCSRCGATINY